MAKPKIRFKGYTTDWEQRKLSDCAGFRRGSFPQPYGNKDWYDGEGAMPFVQVADVSDDMKLVDDTKQKISKLAQPMSVCAEEGSVLVTLQGSIGRVAITQYKAFVDRTVLIFDKYNADIDKTFWAYIIKEKFIEEARKAPGGTIKTITKEVLSDFDLMLPSYDEQKMLGKLLHSLDHLITLHQRKYDEVKKLKKFMLQKMFPQNGQKVPEIRFAGFTEDWEQRKLGELVKEGILEAPLDGNHGEKHPTSDEYVDSGIPFLMASDIHNGEVNIHSCKYITKERAERLDKGFARNGDVLLTHKATIGETAILSNLMTEYAMLTPQVTYYRIKNEERLNREYLYSFFNSLDFQTELKTKAAQSTRPYIGITAQQNLKIILPAEIDEQRKIGLYFRNRDHLITLHQQKCDELKNIKKFMLQNMFV